MRFLISCVLFALGLGCGLAVGSLVAFLFAPSPGDETRDSLCRLLVANRAPGGIARQRWRQAQEAGATEFARSQDLLVTRMRAARQAGRLENHN